MKGGVGGGGEGGIPSQLPKQHYHSLSLHRLLTDQYCCLSCDCATEKTDAE